MDKLQATVTDTFDVPHVAFWRFVRECITLYYYITWIHGVAYW